MVKFLLFEDIDKKSLFSLGKFGFMICLISWGFLMFTNIIDKRQDLKSYYNFWQHIWPMDVTQFTRQQALEFFEQNSLFS